MTKLSKLSLALLALGGVTLSACNTVGGFGRDVEGAGRGLSNSARGHSRDHDRDRDRNLNDRDRRDGYGDRRDMRQGEHPGENPRDDWRNTDR